MNTLITGTPSPVFEQKKSLLKAALSQGNSLARSAMLPVSPVTPVAPADLESLKKLPGYGIGFLWSGDISEAVAVFGP